MIRSSFFYGFTVTEANNKLDFNEGSGELQATLAVGLYSLTTFIAECARAMGAVGSQSYSASVNRTTRIVTFSAAASFSLLAATGTRRGQGPWSLLGLAINKTGSVIAMDSAAGSEFRPQFPLQSYVPPENWRQYLKAVVNESAFGDVEVVRYGQIQLTKFNVMFQTNKPTGSGNPIENNPTGVDDLIDFMNFATTKGLVEFMFDRSNPSQFKTIRLETTEESSQGTGFQLKEQYGRGLPNFFDSGDLKWRVIS